MSVLTLENVTYKYDGATKQVLKNISMDFKPGKVYVIMGKSGAGKSTILSLISGLDLPTSGDVLFKGKSLKQIGRAHV